MREIGLMLPSSSPNHSRRLLRRHSPILLGVILLLSFFSQISAQYPFTFPLTCDTTSQYFSTPNLSCLDCPANSVSYSSSIWQSNPYLNQYTSSTTEFTYSPTLLTKYSASAQTTPCVCNANYYKSSTTAFGCTACATNTVALSDQSACVSCDAATTTLNTTLGDCVCNTAGYVLKELDSTGTLLTAKTCAACPTNTVLSSTNRYTCLSCPDSRMTLPSGATSISQCQCPTGYTIANNKCLLTTELSAITTGYQSSKWGVVTYAVAATDETDTLTNYVNTNSDISLVSVTSPIIYNTFSTLAVLCKNNKHMPSCQALANYCVLNNFDVSHETCRFMSDLQTASSTITYGFVDWRVGLPWLFVSDSGIRESTVLSGVVKLKGSNGIYSPDFVVAGQDSGNVSADDGYNNMSSDVQFQNVIDSIKKTRENSSKAQSPQSSASSSFLSTLASALTSIAAAVSPLDATTTTDTVGTSFHTLSYILSTYTINGTLVSHEPLTTQLMLCPHNSVDDVRYLDFGTEYTKDCDLDLTQLITQPTLFYELHYIDADSKWYPVFVKSANYISGASRPNLDGAGKEVSNDGIKLSRRFFLVDTLSTVPIAATMDGTAYPVILTYARTISLRVQMRAGSVQQIYPPVLWIKYSSRRVSSILGYDPNVTPSPFMTMSHDGVSQVSEAQFTASVMGDADALYLSNARDSYNYSIPYTASEFFTAESVSTLATAPRSIASKAYRVSSITFKQEYHKDIGKIEIATIVLFWIFFAFVVVWWVVKIIVLRKKSGSGLIGFGEILEYVCLLLGIVSELMFWIAFGCAAVVFLFYKAQEAVHVLLPSSDNFISQSLLPFLVAAFIMSFLYIVSLIVGQLSADLLFVDWETPVASLHPGMQRNGVSLWRRVYAITRWIDLQAMRKHNVPASLCILLFLVKACGLEGLATAQPDGNDLSLDFPISPILRCFITALFFLLAAGLQKFIFWLCYGWVWPDPTINFCDLLTNCNVSMIVFDGYVHCYYIHGKNVHDSADVSIAEFRKQREQERLGWVRPRGLVNNISIFSVYITPELRRIYDDMFVDARNKAIIASIRDNDNAGVQGKIAVNNLPSMQMTNMMNYTPNNVGNANAGVGVGNNVVSGNPVTPFTASFGMEMHHESIISAKKAEESLNRLWIDFIDKTSTLHKWMFVQRNGFSSWLDIGGSRVASSENSSMFCEDNRKHVESLLLYGIEYNLLIFYTITLCMFENAFNSTLVAVCVVYAFDYFIMAARRKFGRVNTAKKALLEDRYIL